MKRSFTFFSMALLVILFSSCSKDYTCTCTVTSKGVDHAISKHIGATGKDDAQGKCDAMRTQYADSVSGVGAVCHL